MANEKKFCSDLRLRIYSSQDLSKKWFVEYYDDQGRQRVYGSINKASTFEGRMELAMALKKEIEHKYKPAKIKDQTLVLEWMQSQNWRPKSYSTALTCLNAWFEFIGRKKATPELAQTFFAQMRSTKNPSTHNKYLQAISAAWAGIGRENIFADIKNLKINPEPARYFQVFQIRRLSREISEADPQLFLFIQFIYYCFIRPRELVMLRAGNILLESNQIYIPGNVSKNKKSEYISIPVAFRNSLKHIERMAPNELLFPSPVDITKPLGFDKMYRRHQRILKRLDLLGKGYVLYSWKHTGAVMAVRAGISLKELQMQLRHHSLDQVDQYLRQMGVWDLNNLQEKFPRLAS